MDPHNQDDPPSTKSTRPLEYRRPAEPWERPTRGRLFGNVWGNAAMGAVVFGFSCIIGAKMANIAGARDVWPYVSLPIATLALGVAATFSPRYRGLLTGMLLVVAICIGLALLLIGICTGRFK